MAAGRKIEDEAEAQRCVAAAQRSGIGLGQWARTRGIDGRSLHAWAVNLERRGTSVESRAKRPASAARGLVELVPAVPGVAVATKARYVLDVAGARIEFGDDASVSTLRRVLEALRSC